jgi:hypothetical protein
MVNSWMAAAIVILVRHNRRHRHRLMDHDVWGYYLSNSMTTTITQAFANT